MSAIIGNTPGAAWLTARVWCCQITAILLFIGRYLLGVATVAPEATAGCRDEMQGFCDSARLSQHTTFRLQEKSQAMSYI